MMLPGTVLKQLVQQVSYLDLVAVCTKPSEAVNLLKKEQVDLAFLDIEMPEMTGMELLGSIAMPPTILTTTHKEYALNAFEHNVIDYLVKPVTLPRFIKAVEKAKAMQDKQGIQDGVVERDYFFIKKDSVHTKVPTKDILWVEALGDYITIHTINGKYILHLTLKSIESKLPPDKFIRVHRSYIVNIDNVGMVEDTTIFINNTSIPVGALYKDNFIRVLNLL